MREVDHLILGGGGAGAAAAATLRLEGAAGSVMILSADRAPPYHRPSLSKQLLLGTADERRILLRPESFYQDQAIELALNARAAAVDPGRQVVTTAAGEEIRYGRLLIATGSRPKRLLAPGEELPGVHYLRRRADCDAIRARIASGARRAIVLGGSFLGLEIAMSLIELGLEVTIVECEGVVLPHVEAPEVSAYFRRHAEERGAQILLGETIAAIHGGDRIREAELASGRRLPCDMLVVSIGVEPDTGFLEQSGIALDEGLVLVDELLQTSAPNVFAAGDVTSFYDPVFARRRHIEHWDNAEKQGHLAARNMLGQRRRYDEVSYFFCDVGDVSFSMLGAPEEAEERIGRGSLEEKSFALFYLKGDLLRAFFTIGRPVEETSGAKGLIRYRVNLRDAKGRLHDPAFALDRLPTQTVLVLQGGGALGAFECGVVKALEEERIFPDIVAGISIGALNGAIIAAHPRHAAEALEAFWSDISVRTPPAACEEVATAAASLGILMYGVPNFFRPRWLPSFSAPMTPPMSWTSFYDIGPMRELIAKYVDFPKLRNSPVRLMVGAVDVATAELEIFDSYVDGLTPDHILASGSLPPGFPWTEIDGKAYWDGGVISNSPLDIVTDRCGPDGKRVFIVDLFSGQRPLPANMMEVMARRDEIVYSERVRSDLRLRELVGAYRGLVSGILGLVDPAIQAKIRQRPLYLELMGDGAPTRITRFVRPGRPGEPASRDYDFSDVSVRFNQKEGYALARRTLGTSSEQQLNAGPVPGRHVVPRNRSLPKFGDSDGLSGPEPQPAGPGSNGAAKGARRVRSGTGRR
ncbi:FAD-dependent oxidoreductase [Siccirubricoccus sp. KC 17139]|uniref:FAD-dependent oxidoreductase n=1 Tax=Siccirubricoccus soli TaxID=2899147 RepID=A0ABT1DCD9_9PROT|nr:FAD-dependent oxidoreductase [Siccirubricoccus soli]MCO6419603.1 FAD-dependent oxidoreductase [Siccirubricoccus soli]MCP2685738.1 FAD-dependent oxidoreductase [Siccirubricoccus soli]